MQRFSFGQVVMSHGASQELELDEVFDLLARHGALEQGELGADDYSMNIKAVEEGDRVFSCYRVRGERYYVITEWDRSVTTILKPEEY